MDPEGCAGVAVAEDDCVWVQRAGTFSLAVDLNTQGAGPVCVFSGGTWSFQAWRRDQVGFGFNLTDGLSVDSLKRPQRLGRPLAPPKTKK